MNIYIDIQKTRSTDWLNAPCYGGTIMPFDELPKIGDIIQRLYVRPDFVKNNPDLENVPDGSYEVICEPFELNMGKENPLRSNYKMMVCSSSLPKI